MRVTRKCQHTLGEEAGSSQRRSTGTVGLSPQNLIGDRPSENPLKPCAMPATNDVCD